MHNLARLLATGADVNKTDMYDRTALSAPSANGHAAIVAALLAAGADVNKAGNGRETPRITAFDNAHSDIVAQILAADARPMQGHRH